MDFSPVGGKKWLFTPQPTNILIIEKFRRLHKREKSCLLKAKKSYYNSSECDRFKCVKKFSVYSTLKIFNVLCISFLRPFRKSLLIIFLKYVFFRTRSISWVFVIGW